MFDLPTLNGKREASSIQLGASLRSAGRERIIALLGQEFCRLGGAGAFACQLIFSSLLGER